MANIFTPDPSYLGSSSYLEDASVSIPLAAQGALSIATAVK